MRYVVAYDVAEDRARSRVAERLEELGFRVQASVFECELERDEVEALLDELAQMIASSVRAYRLCRDCLAASLKVATEGARQSEDDPCFLA